jgi:hypothetical protein
LFERAKDGIFIYHWTTPIFFFPSPAPEVKLLPTGRGFYAEVVMTSGSYHLLRLGLMRWLGSPGYCESVIGPGFLVRCRECRRKIRRRRRLISK